MSQPDRCTTRATVESHQDKVAPLDLAAHRSLIHVSSLYAPFTFRAHPVYTSCMSHCPMYAPFPRRACSMNILCMCHAFFVHAQCRLIARSLHAQCIRSMHAPYTHCACYMHARCTLRARSVQVPYALCARYMQARCYNSICMTIKVFQTTNIL